MYDPGYGNSKDRKAIRNKHDVDDGRNNNDLLETYLKPAKEKSL